MSPQILLLLLLLSLLPLSLSQQTCSNDILPQSKPYSLCNSLAPLSATLHWTYHPSNASVDIAFRTPQTSAGWIGWALNPTASGMNGAETIFAFHDSNGVMTTVTYPITYQNTTVKNSSLSFKVYSMSSEFSNNVMSVYASIELPGNRTRVNHVWQAADLFSKGMPSGHATSGANLKSTATLDLLSGESMGSGDLRLHRKNIHGILNAVSWGILMPIGAIIARYLRVFKSADPAWFYLHVACQCSAYIVGVAGWGTGLKLGSDSKGITYHSHRDIGIALFCLATLQVFALLLRPKKDHKYRLYWNIYHHCIGYTVIILSVINIFKGFDILDPEKKWKHAYIGIIAALGGIAAVLEVVTWGIVLKRKRNGSDKSHRDGANGVNGLGGTNGYGGRQHQVV